MIDRKIKTAIGIGLLTIVIAIYWLSGTHLVNDIPLQKRTDVFATVVEIPAGTNDKWEVNKETGKLEWQVKNGKNRIIQYLPYPVNYGFLPQTLLSKASGGDDDPLDVLILGPAIPRKSVVEVRVIGLVGLSDGGEKDHKIVAVPVNSYIFKDISSMTQLNEEFPGLLTIITQWFYSYKGIGKIEILGLFEQNQAKALIDFAHQEYLKSQS